MTVRKTIEQLQQEWANEPPPPPDTRPPWERLTNREREIATMLALGETCAEIGRALGISTKTVDTHRANLLEKTGCRGNVALTRWMIREGHVTP